MPRPLFKTPPVKVERSKYITAKEIQETLDCSSHKAYEILHSLDPIYVGRSRRALRSKFEEWERQAGAMANARRQDREAEIRQRARAEQNIAQIRKQNNAIWKQNKAALAAQTVRS